MNIIKSLKKIFCKEREIEWYRESEDPEVRTRELHKLSQSKSLGIYSKCIKEIKYIECLTQLESLHLYGNLITEIKNLDSLIQLTELDLCRNQIREIKNLENLTQLTNLNLSCNRITEMRGLDQLTQLVHLYLSRNHISQIQGLDKLTQLKVLDLFDNQITEIGGLDKLTQLNTLSLCSNKLREIKNLDSLTQLESLYLYENQITELKGLGNLVNLEILGLDDNPLGVGCLEKLLEYKKGSLLKLKRVFLNNVNIDWYSTKVGNLAWELKRLGVEVIGDNVQYIPPPASSSLIEQFISKIDPDGKLTEQEVSIIFNELQKRTKLAKQDIDEIVLTDKGYTSRTGFEFKDRFIKFDIAPRLRHEYSVYCLDLGDFNPFRAAVNPTEFVESGGFAILAMDNLNHYTPGIVKANFKQENIPFNLYLMSLFHKESSKHKDKFRQVIYYGVHGLPHWEESIVPQINASGEGYKRFQETEIDFRKAKPIVEKHILMQKSAADTVIHGDWKPENMVNGHMVDYAMVGIGFEVDELAYYLSDSRFQMNLLRFHEMVDKYIKLRSEHDLDFKLKVELSYRQTMHQLADSAFLSQLVLRHSVMNKRDMIDNTKFEQRQYYQHAINQVLREGRFV